MEHNNTIGSAAKKMKELQKRLSLDLSGKIETFLLFFRKLYQKGIEWQ